MRLVGFAFAGVEPELMGIGPIPATERVLEQAGLTLDDVGLFELNEPFAVQVLTWCDALGVDPEDARLNPYGGAIACGHPLAATGVRPDGAARVRLRRASRCALRTDGALRRAWAWARLSCGRTLAPVTEFKLARAGDVALVTIDNGEDWTKPTFFGEQRARVARPAARTSSRAATTAPR